jgi:hypothetical protein
MACWVLCVGLMLLTLAGCSPGGIPEKVFEQKAAQAGFEVVDITEEYSEQSGSEVVKKVLGFYEDPINVQWFEFDSEANAEYFYEGNIGLVESNATYLMMGTKVSGTDSQYTVIADGSYVLLKRIGTTVVCARTSMEDSTRLDNFIESLG